MDYLKSFDESLFKEDWEEELEEDLPNLLYIVKTLKTLDVKPKVFSFKDSYGITESIKNRKTIKIRLWRLDSRIEDYWINDNGDLICSNRQKIEGLVEYADFEKLIEDSKEVFLNNHKKVMNIAVRTILSRTES